jgi:sensor c-di-GMP phosphodiesterase-like protein
LNKRAAIAVAIIVGLVAVALPITASVYMAWKQSFDEHMAGVATIAQDVLRRSNESTDQTFAIYRRLEAAASPDPCSDQNIRLMASLDLGSEQVQAIGYVKNDRLLCSSFGRHDTPVGPPAYLSASGAYIRPSIEFPVLPGRKFLLSTSKDSGFSAAISHRRPLDVFLDKADVSVGVFAYPRKQLVMNRGAFNARWMDALGEAHHAQFSDGEHLVAIHRSDKHGFAAFAAIPAANVNEGLRRTALILVPIGVAAGLALALAVLHLARQQLALPAVLKVALKRDEFFLLYQPIVELRGGRCVGAEALIRWRRPNGEMVRPDVFIPVAEETGLIHQITRRVMDIVAQDTAQLLKLRPDLHIGINLSSLDLQLDDTPQMVRDLIEKMGVQPHNILVEATERGLMEADKARRIIGEIRALKLKIAIDDFGTGYSSLSYLEKFPLDFLKIDKSFVDTMGGKTATSQVAVHIIEMAKSLNLEMIAEGVETEQQVRFLQERGVQFAQGWFFGKPMPVRELASFVAKMEKQSAQAM